MKELNNPDKSLWSSLCQRPVINAEILEESVRGIMNDVARNGDRALERYTKSLDGVSLKNFAVSTNEIESAKSQVSTALQNAIGTAQKTIESFHMSQQLETMKIETAPGVICWRESRPIERVGLYIPGGSAPLFSTILMLGIPAKIAGCQEIVLCTPPRKDGSVDPAIVYTASLLGIRSIFKVGGAQAIAAMTYGTATIPQVDKLFGPGNQYVTKAKEMAQKERVAIDMPAGPSEVLIIADASANPEFVAADLLSQAEHGVDSQVILLTDSEQIRSNVLSFLEKQLAFIPRAEIASKALENSLLIQFDSLDLCFEFSNQYAPEHLIIASEEATNWIGKVQNAGSVFLGNYSCESAGDYASGTNHTLPTNGYARNYSGVSLDSFVKKITFQELTPQGVMSIGDAVVEMAAAEALDAHKIAMQLRMNQVKNELKISTDERAN